MATEPQQQVTHVEDGEEIYRSVKDLPSHFAQDSTGRLKLGSSAFNDPDKRPSVDRAKHCAEGPQSSRRNEADGVVSLNVGDVRSIAGVVTNDKKGKPLQSHAVDVVHHPEDDNFSHALVVTNPDVVAEPAFKRLKEALCLLAERRGWVHVPASQRS